MINPDENGMYKVIWPCNRKVSADELIIWAKDDIANSETNILDNVENIDDAITVLQDTGSVTFGR